MIELVLSGLALLLLAPVMAVAALAVRLDSPGPVLYRETRLGRGGQWIGIFKFRTLHCGADHRRRVVPANDPRITRVGRLLRPAHVDELPQLLAVIGGSMSLIGPRPERPGVWAAVAPELRERALALRPGLISPASLRYECEDFVLAEFAQPETLYREVLLPTKLREDLEYFAARTLGSDLKLLARTIWRVWCAPEREECGRRVRALLAAHRPGRVAAVERPRQ